MPMNMDNAKQSWLRQVYDWMLVNSRSRGAFWILGAVSFAESSFFPFPPDVMLIPMALADRKRAWLLAMWCTFTSVLGGMLGYYIGAGLYDTLGQWLIKAYGYGAGMEEFRRLYTQYGAWIILIDRKSTRLNFSH